MIWLTWRQARTQTIVAASALAVFAIILLITGFNIQHIYNTSGVIGCAAHHDCMTQAQNYIHGLKNNPLYFLLFYIGIALMYLVPAILGVFWGAPLITRELESGTIRMAWNQSIGRGRWLATKLALIGLISMAIAGLLSLVETWWSSPIVRVAQYNQGGIINRFGPVLFGSRGITPIGYAAFAFVLGVTAGLVFRRTLPAMAVTLAVFAGIQIFMPVVVRPNLIAPVQHISAVNSQNFQGLGVNNNGQMAVFTSQNEPNAWVLSNATLNSSGGPLTAQAPAACMNQNAPIQQCQDALIAMNLKSEVTYQPMSRYWEFQWIETVIFLIAAGILAGFCFLWIGRRQIA